MLCSCFFMKELMFSCCFRFLEMMITRNWKDFTESTRQGCKKTGSGGAGFPLNSTIVNTVLTVKTTLKVWYGPVDPTCVHLLVLTRCSLVLVLRVVENCPSNTSVLLEWEYSSSCIIIAECWVSGGYWISLWYHNDRSAFLWYRLLKVKPQGHVTHSGISFRKLSAEFLIFHLFFPEDKLRA